MNILQKIINKRVGGILNIGNLSISFIKRRAVEIARCVHAARRWILNRASTRHNGTCLDYHIIKALHLNKKKKKKKMMMKKNAVTSLHPLAPSVVKPRMTKIVKKYNNGTGFSTAV